MSQILLATRGIVLDDESGNSFSIGSILNLLTYKDNNDNLNTFYGVLIKCIDYKYIHISINGKLTKIKINDIVSWN